MKKLKQYCKERLLLVRAYVLFRSNKKVYKVCKALRVADRTETIRYILENHCSVSRFGDGEFAVMMTVLQWISEPEQGLGRTLDRGHKRTYTQSHCLHTRNVHRLFKSQSVCAVGHVWFPCISWRERFSPLCTHTRYFDADCTRFYMSHKNKKPIPEYVELMKQIWEGKDLLIVEGVYSRLGYLNDLLDNARSIIRIQAPAQDAFDHYEEILQAAKRRAEGRLVLIALGMTATVLAYDLAKEGIQAIDIGHVDIEYCWWKMGAKRKVPVPGKIVAEVGQKSIDDQVDESFSRQVVERIGV